MPDELTKHDSRLRAILTEVSMGRLTVDEAFARIDDLKQPKPAKSGKPSIGAGLLIFAFGAVFASIGGYFAAKSLSFSHDSGRVEGTVVKHERSGNKGNRVPIVSYTVDGQKYEHRGDIASNSPPAVHSKVTILYKTADPNEAQIDSFVQRWLFPLIFGGIGGVAALVGMIVLLRAIAGRFRSAALASPDALSERFTV